MLAKSLRRMIKMIPSQHIITIIKLLIMRSTWVKTFGHTALFSTRHYFLGDTIKRRFFPFHKNFF